MELRKLLKQAIQENLSNYPNYPIALELSGGCDSVSLFLCLRDLGKQFEAHTYAFKASADLKASIAICKRYGVKHFVHQVHEKEIVTIEQELIIKGFPTNPTSLDCLIGHAVIAREIHNTLIVNGSFADVLWGAYGFLSRLKATSIEAFMTKRSKMMMNPDQDGVQSLRRLYAETNCPVVYPYMNKDVIDAFLKLPPSMLNDKKKIFFEEFGAEIKDIKVRRRSQQIASGIRDYRKSKLNKV